MSETAVLNYDDPELQRVIERGDYNVFGFSAKTDLHSGAFLKNGKLVIRHGDEELVICKREDMLIPGEHNISNALAACAACFTAKIPPECMREALKRFPGVPQRLELIREWRSRRFFNDTAATTPESVLAAISSFDSPLILIMGGGLKGGDYGILKESLKKVKKIILLKSPLSEYLKKNLNLGSVIETDTLKKALLEAWKISKEGDAILLSPGGEYFSYFRDKMPGYKNIRTFVEQIV
jgi:UDP-N-acetylmuramoylalanine--D-glutamate ligase